jgi:hypothetical protein
MDLLGNKIRRTPVTLRRQDAVTQLRLFKKHPYGSLACLTINFINLKESGTYVFHIFI